MIIDLFYKNRGQIRQDKFKKSTCSINQSSEEKIKRSLLKTLSWRVIGTLDTIIISYLITGRLTMAISIGGIEMVSKMVLYFFHERAWNTIKWGK